MTLQLFAFPGSSTYDVPSLDAASLIAASYLQLLRPGAWEIVYSTNPGLSPNGALPYLKDGQEYFSASSILTHLLRTAEGGRVTESADDRAFHALLDSSLLPLALHSLFSLPQNWLFVRRAIANNLSYPFKLYKPEQLRQGARFVVEATHEEWWGLGGEAEKDEEAERKRKKLLLDSRLEAYKERKDEERKENKEKIKKTFGEGKMASVAREIFTTLESTLAKSSTAFFFSSPTATPLDAHLAAILSLVLFLPLPQPLLADQINASFPRIWAHTALLRRTLWSSPPSQSSTAPFSLLSFLGDFAPTGLTSRSFSGDGTTAKADKTKSKKEQDFEAKRWIFAGVVAVGMLGWAAGVGAIPLPGRPGIWARSEYDEEEEEVWERVE